MNFRARYKAELPGFQIAPMIDVIFLLLCFFITTQIFTEWETEIPIQLPTVDTGQVPRRLPGEIIVNILQDGSVKVHGQERDEAALLGLLERIAQLWYDQPVVIRADRRTAYEHVIRVIDLCRKADIANLSFATGVAEEGAAP